MTARSVAWDTGEPDIKFHELAHDSPPADKEGRRAQQMRARDVAPRGTEQHAAIEMDARHLVDGQLVQVSVEGDKPEERVVVPQAALIADQQGIYVFIVEDGKAATRRVKVGQAVGGSVVITDGLSGGELVVITGIQSLKPGMAVLAVPAEKPVGG